MEAELDQRVRYFIMQYGGKEAFEQIAGRYGMGLATMPAVGDTSRDMIAAIGVACTPHVVQTGKGALWRGQPLPEDFPPQTMVHADLSAFADYLVARS